MSNLPILTAVMSDAIGGGVPASQLEPTADISYFINPTTGAAQTHFFGLYPMQTDEWNIVEGGQLDPTIASNFGLVAAQYNIGQASNWDYTNFRWVRDHYSHDSIMAGNFMFPTGYGLGDDLQAIGTAICKVIKAVAPFIAMIPGVGTVIGAGLYAVGSLGAGDRIDQVVIDTIEQVLPDGVKTQFKEAVDIGYDIGRGKPWSQAAIDLGRTQAMADGGPQAVGAFDAGIALGTGKGLQEAGFKLLGAWAAGTNSDERALSFIAAMAQATAEGKTIQQVLFAGAQTAFFSAVPAAQQAYVLEQAIQYFIAHPDEVVDPDTSAIADRLGIPIDAIRAAIVCLRQMADGTLVPDPGATQQFNVIFAANVKTNATATGGASMFQAALGLPELASSKLANDAYQAKGYALSQTDPVAMATRATNGNALWKRGYDIGTAITNGKSVDGPGQKALAATLLDPNEVAGYQAAQKIQYQLTLSKASTMNTVTGLGRMIPLARQQQLDALQVTGAAQAQSNPTIAILRASDPNPLFTKGFDMAIAGCAGTSIGGNGQDAIRADLGTYVGGGQAATQAQHGFDVGQSLAHGMTKASLGLVTLSANPAVAGGQMVVTGIAGGVQTPDQKAAIVQTVVTANPAVKAGAAATVPTVQKSFFQKVWDFFGL